MSSELNRQSVQKKHSDRLGWSVSRKLLMLLLLPLAAQLLLFAALTFALVQAQSLSEKQFQEQRLISILDQVLIDRGASFTGSFERALRQLPISAGNQRKILERVSRHLNEVRENQNVDPELLKSVDEIEASYIPEEEQRARFTSVGILGKLQMFSQETDELENFHDQIFVKLSRNQSEYAAARDKINVFALVLIICVFLDLCAAFIALFFFNRSLSRALRALTENSKKVSTEEELPNKLDGNDELQTIDEALHQSHRRLQEARRQRQSVNAMIAHDVRTPLQSIGLLIHKLSIELGKTANPLVLEVQKLEKDVQAVHKHVEDLLVVEKLDAGKIALRLAEVDLKALIADACRSSEETASKKDLRLNLQLSECSVIGDAARLSQVVHNYLSNAIKFSPRGAEVVVQLVVTPELVSVRVRDSGEGIKASEQAQLFSKFSHSSLNRDDMSIGIGLAICKELIELHGGEVGVISKPGAGSTFWFTLPIDEMD